MRGPIHAEARRTGKSFLDGVLAGMFTVPGDGSIDFGAVMKALKQIDYSGWIIIEAEQDPAHRQPAHLQRTRPRDAEARSGRAGLI